MEFNKLVESLLEEDNTNLYRVSHYGLGVNEKTTANSPEQARTYVFNRLLKAGTLKKSDWKNRFDRAEVRAIPSLKESLLLEQPHMDFNINGYNILFDPELESKDYRQAVELFQQILAGEKVSGKYQSFIQLPQGYQKGFCQALVQDIGTINFIKLWLSKKTNSGITIKKFFIDTGMYDYIK